MDIHDFAVDVLNERLPRKRVIGHGLIRDEAGRVLLCELTYKQRWDLPGGVVEPGESPRTGCLREVAEELGYVAPAGALLAVNWMAPWGGWDDACTFLYDLGVLPADAVTDLRLQAREIHAVHWCTPDEVQERAAAATARLLARVLAGPGPDGGPLYLENGADPA